MEEGGDQNLKSGGGGGGCSDDLKHQKTKQGPFLHNTKKQAAIKFSFLPPSLSTSALGPIIYPPYSALSLFYGSAASSQSYFECQGAFLLQLLFYKLRSCSQSC